MNEIHMLALLAHFLRRIFARFYGFRLVAMGIEEARNSEVKDL